MVHAGKERAEVGDHPALGRGLVLRLPGDDAVQGEVDAIKAEKALLDAKAQAEVDAALEVATKRIEHLRALGLPGEIKPAKAEKKWRYSTEEWKTPIEFTTEHVHTITLTAEQVDALLALIPDGAGVMDRCPKCSEQFRVNDLPAHVEECWG